MVDTARTIDQLIAIFADGQANNAINEQDLRDLIMSVKYLGPQGWTFDFDSEFNLGSPRVITAGTRTKLTNNGLLESVGSPEPGLFWDKVNSKILPSALNDFGIVRLSFTGKSNSAPVNRFELELDTAGDFPIIYRSTAVFAKGAGEAQNFNFIIPLFAGPDFLANGGEFYITPEADASFWENAITANRTYAAYV